MSRVIRLRQSGFIYIIITIVLGMLAVNSGNNLLYLVTAVMLGYMLSSGVVGRRNIFAASVAVEFPNEIFAKIPCGATVKLTNNSRSASVFLIKIESEGGAFFPVVPPKSTVEKNMNFTFPERGELRIGELEFSSVYPFNFFTRYWQSDLEKRVIIFPSPLKSENKDKKNETMSPDLDVAGVRPYKEGDQMRHIHWKSSARTGKLKTRLYEAENALARIIDLDKLVASDVELGLSMATSAIVEAINQNCPVGLLSKGRVIPPNCGQSHKRELLTELALYDAQRQ